jgi:hypothetical protein
MFDCVLVKRSALAQGKLAMLEEFERIAGKPARVTVEEPRDHRDDEVERRLQEAANF